MDTRALYIESLKEFKKVLDKEKPHVSFSKLTTISYKILVDIFKLELHSLATIRNIPKDSPEILQIEKDFLTVSFVNIVKKGLYAKKIHVMDHNLLNVPGHMKTLCFSCGNYTNEKIYRCESNYNYTCIIQL